MDLWSVMSFINPGLLGTQAFFVRESSSPLKATKAARGACTPPHQALYSGAWRHKAQVAAELPKTEQPSYCTTMTEEQAHAYEGNQELLPQQNLRNLDENGQPAPSFYVGLTRLRQIANHPRLSR
jgi:SNF2 family DNA or RNA helicase